MVKEDYWKQIHEATGKPDFHFIVGDFNVNDFYIRQIMSYINWR